MKKPLKTARSVPANRGIEAKYRKELQRMIAEMHGSYQYWITAAYRKNPPRMAKVVDQAQDAKPGEYASTMQNYASVYSPSAKISKVIDALGERWVSKFDAWAPKIAEAYLKGMFKTSDNSFMQALKDAGWTVQFKMTPAVRDAFTASLEENVGLIRSIPAQYSQQIEGIVMRSYSAGRDLEIMTKDLKALYPKAAGRAELIARDQSNKANAVVNRTRQLELGITEAIWMHSHAGKTPRPGHLKAGNEKRRYNIAQGCLIDGEYIQPGEKIACRCTSRPILPF